MNGTIDVALTPGAVVELPGNKYFCLLSTPSPVSIEITANRGQVVASYGDVSASFKAYFKDGFSSARISSSVAQTVKVGVFDENVEQAENTSVISVVNLGAGSIVTVADTTIVQAAAAAQILAANASRKKVMISSLIANTQPVRIGDNNTGAAQGIEINPGEMLEMDTSDAIFAYTAAGVNQVLAIAYTS